MECSICRALYSPRKKNYQQPFVQKNENSSTSDKPPSSIEWLKAPPGGPTIEMIAHIGGLLKFHYFCAECINFENSNVYHRHGHRCFRIYADESQAIPRAAVHLTHHLSPLAEPCEIILNTKVLAPNVYRACKKATADVKSHFGLPEDCICEQIIAATSKFELTSLQAVEDLLRSAKSVVVAGQKCQDHG